MAGGTDLRSDFGRNRWGTAGRAKWFCRNGQHHADNTPFHPFHAGNSMVTTKKTSWILSLHSESRDSHMNLKRLQLILKKTHLVLGQYSKCCPRDCYTLQTKGGMLSTFSEKPHSRAWGTRGNPSFPAILVHERGSLRWFTRGWERMERRERVGIVTYRVWWSERTLRRMSLARVKDSVLQLNWKTFWSRSIGSRSHALMRTKSACPISFDKFILDTPMDNARRLLCQSESFGHSGQIIQKGTSGGDWPLTITLSTVLNDQYEYVGKKKYQASKVLKYSSWSLWQCETNNYKQLFTSSRFVIITLIQSFRGPRFVYIAT